MKGLFKEYFTDTVVSMVTDGHKRLEQLKLLKEQYHYMIQNCTMNDCDTCSGCNHYFEAENNVICAGCDETFCGRFLHCTLKRCISCKDSYCFKDMKICKICDNILCINCTDGKDCKFCEEVLSSGASSFSVYSDSDPSSPSTSRSEDSDG